MGALFILLFGFFTVIRTGPALRRARSSSVEVDEGGVRLRTGPLVTYLPFNLLHGAEVEHGLGRATFRLYDRNRRPLAQIPVFGMGMREIEAAEEIRLRAAEGQRQAELPSVLQRRGRPLDAWAAALDEEGARMASEEGYRGEPLDLPTARVDAADPKVHPESRAALAALLLATRDPDDERLVAGLLGPSSPPLLVGMVARLRPALVEAALREETESFLADEA